MSPASAHNEVAIPEFVPQVLLAHGFFVRACEVLASRDRLEHGEMGSLWRVEAGDETIDDTWWSCGTDDVIRPSTTRSYAGILGRNGFECSYRRGSDGNHAASISPRRIHG